MKLRILHDSLSGNGEKLAQTLGKTFEKEKMEVKIEHVTKISPAEVVKDSPDALNGCSN